MTDLTDAIAAGIAEIPVLERVAPNALAYGVDLSCIRDVTPDLAEVDPTSPAAVGQGALRRLLTPRGGVVDDQAYGLDLRAYTSHGVTNDELRGLAAQVRAEAMKDDRVSEADATIAYAAGKLDVTLMLTLVDSSETFTLIFFVTPDGIELIDSIDRT